MASSKKTSHQYKGKSKAKHNTGSKVKLWKKRTPNMITLARGMLVFPIIILVLGSPIQAFCGWFLFFIACVGDHLDGYLARRWDAISLFGQAFDPILDKILVFALFLAVLARNGIDDGIVPQQLGNGMSAVAFICASLIITREIIISGLREFLAQKAHGSLPVTRLAKYKTVLQMLGVGGQSLSVAALDGQRLLWFSLLADAVLLIACVVTIYTGWLYTTTAFSTLQKSNNKSL